MENSAFVIDRNQNQRISSLGRIITGIILVLIALAYILPADSTRAAATFTVDILGDWPDTLPGDGICDGAYDNNTVYCTLRAAIQEANALSGPDTIDFDTNLIPPGSTLNLVYNMHRIDEDLTIQGPGATYLTIDGDQNWRIFEVGSNVSFNLSDITLTGGDENLGGAILTRQNSDVTIDSVRFLSNSSFIYGGALYNERGVVTIKNSLFEGNRSGSVGGAVYSYLDARTYLINSTFNDNFTQTSRCKSIYAGGGSSLVSLHNVTLVNSTGGISTLCAESGSAIFYENSILEGNQSSLCDPFSQSSSQHYNILSDSTCDMTAYDQVISYPNTFSQVLENALKDNGGETETYALLSNGQALDYGNPTDCQNHYNASLTEDQRREIRPFPYSGRCDIGAYEFSPSEYDGSEQTCGGECAVDSAGRVCTFCPPVTVTVPPNTVPDGSRVTVMQLPTPSSGASFELGSRIFDITVFGPDNRLIDTFSTPLKICIMPTSEDLSKAAGNYDHLKMFHKHYGGTWTLVSNPYKENSYLCAEVSQLSFFGIGVPGLPDTGFEPGTITALPVLPSISSGKSYTSYPTISLKIPALNVNLPIVGVPLTEEGWDVTWLGDAAGYLQGTAFPTWTGNTAITGHVWGADNQPGPFLGLRGLHYGDQVVINAWGIEHIYQVRRTMIVKPDSLRALPHSEYDLLTLITCQGFDQESGEYGWRYAVQAVLVDIRE